MLLYCSSHWAKLRQGARAGRLNLRTLFLARLPALPAGTMTFPWANNNTPVPLTAHELMAAAEAEAALRQLNMGNEVPLPNLSPRPPPGGTPASAQRQPSVGLDSGAKAVPPHRAASVEPPGRELD